MSTAKAAKALDDEDVLRCFYAEHAPQFVGRVGKVTASFRKKAARSSVPWQAAMYSELNSKYGVDPRAFYIGEQTRLNAKARALEAELAAEEEDFAERAAAERAARQATAAAGEEREARPQRPTPPAPPSARPRRQSPQPSRQAEARFAHGVHPSLRARNFDKEAAAVEAHGRTDSGVLLHVPKWAQFSEDEAWRCGWCGRGAAETRQRLAGPAGPGTLCSLCGRKHRGHHLARTAVVSAEGSGAQEKEGAESRGGEQTQTPKTRLQQLRSTSAQLAGEHGPSASPDGAASVHSTAPRTTSSRDKSIGGHPTVLKWVKQPAAEPAAPGGGNSEQGLGCENDAAPLSLSPPKSTGAPDVAGEASAVALVGSPPLLPNPRRPSRKLNRSGGRRNDPVANAKIGEAMAAVGRAAAIEREAADGGGGGGGEGASEALALYRQAAAAVGDVMDAQDAETAIGKKTIATMRAKAAQVRHYLISTAAGCRQLAYQCGHTSDLVRCACGRDLSPALCSPWCADRGAHRGPRGAAASAAG